MDQAFPTVPEVASATMTEVAEAALDQYDNVLVMMRRNPFLSVAIAAGVGFSLALMLR
jgi:ElaB/YqjD/DUF883 family membrane-anchored ribosome-binding protein